MRKEEEGSIISRMENQPPAELLRPIKENPPVLGDVTKIVRIAAAQEQTVAPVWFTNSMNEIRREIYNAKVFSYNASALMIDADDILALRNEQDQLPENFPPSRTALQSLQVEEITTLLNFYNIPFRHESSVENHRTSLQQFLGIRA